jgi:hypothetical protein
MLAAVLFRTVWLRKRFAKFKTTPSNRAFAWLNIGRWWICGTGLVVIAPVVPEMMRDYRKWQRALGFEPAVVNFWRTAFYLELGRLVLEALLVVAIFFILKPRPATSAAAGNSGPQGAGRGDQPREEG